MVYSWDPLAEASAGEGALVAGVADLLAGASLRHFAIAKNSGMASWYGKPLAFQADGNAVP